MELHMEMTVVIEGCTFKKVIGEERIYSEEYGVYLPNTERANTFQELIYYSSEWLQTQP